MYVPEKLKLNKFVDVRIPSLSVMFSRFQGIMPVIPDNAYTGDNIASNPVRKTDNLAYWDAYDKAMQAEENKPKPVQDDTKSE